MSGGTYAEIAAIVTAITAIVMVLNYVASRRSERDKKNTDELYKIVQLRSEENAVLRDQVEDYRRRWTEAENQCSKDKRMYLDYIELLRKQITNEDPPPPPPYPY